jgi:hypothetical protein
LAVCQRKQFTCLLLLEKFEYRSLSNKSGGF